MMFEKKEALYLVDHESYLHLKETVTQTGFAYETFDKATGAAQHTGLITYEEMLENPIRNPLACARVMALQEIGLKGEVVSEVALCTLEQIKEARRAYRKEHPEDAHDHSIRFITSDYNELFRIPDGGKVQIDYAGRHFVSPCVYIDDYHTRIAGRVYHICEFAEMMESGGGTVAPEQEVLMPAFKVVNVFDVSQTDGKPLPTIDVNELTGDVAQYDLFFEALTRACPVPIEFEQIENGARGYFHVVENRIAIQEGMSQVQTVKTAIHEMAHQRLHSIGSSAKANPSETRLTRNHKEVEAESVAFTVCQHYGIDTGDYSFAYVAGWSHGKELPELRASLDKIRTTASEMITEIDSHLVNLHREYVWAHLTAADVKHIECIGSEYMPLSRMAEHTFSCEIAGEAMTLKLHLSQHDDGEGFTIHSEGKDIWETMPESELRRLEPVLISAAELHYWTSEVEQAETIQAVKDVARRFMEDETLGLSREQCQRFWTVIEQKEAELTPPSALWPRPTFENAAD